LYDFLNSSFEICFNSREIVGKLLQKNLKKQNGARAKINSQFAKKRKHLSNF